MNVYKILYTCMDGVERTDNVYADTERRAWLTVVIREHMQGRIADHMLSVSVADGHDVRHADVQFLDGFRTNFYIENGQVATW